MAHFFRRGRSLSRWRGPLPSARPVAPVVAQPFPSVDIEASRGGDARSFRLTPRRQRWRRLFLPTEAAWPALAYSHKDCSSPPFARRTCCGLSSGPAATTISPAHRTRRSHPECVEPTTMGVAGSVLEFLEFAERCSPMIQASRRRSSADQRPTRGQPWRLWLTRRSQASLL